MVFQEKTQDSDGIYIKNKTYGKKIRNHLVT